MRAFITFIIIFTLRISYGCNTTPIIFSSDRDDNKGILVMNTDGTVLIQLTFTTFPTEEFHPSFSTDGSKVVWVSTRKKERRDLHRQAFLAHPERLGKMLR